MRVDTRGNQRRVVFMIGFMSASAGAMAVAAKGFILQSGENRYIHTRVGFTSINLA